MFVSVQILMGLNIYDFVYYVLNIMFIIFII